MEARIARLESDVEYIKRDIHEMKESMVTKDYLDATLNRRTLKAALFALGVIVTTLTWLVQSYFGPILERLSQ